MRYYLIIGTSTTALKSATDLFEKSSDFESLGTIRSVGNTLKLLKFPPELVLINLDEIEIVESMEKLNRILGIIPHYIGITTSLEKGFEAFKAGFVDVIRTPFTKEKIVLALTKYRYTYNPSPIFCLEYYHDFKYLNLHKVVLIKADGYITEFVMKDGSTINHFKSLKHTHQQLPFNFQRIHRSYIINSYYVYRIQQGKSVLYLRHYPYALGYTKMYSNNIAQIKKALLNPPADVFATYQ